MAQFTVTYTVPDEQAQLLLDGLLHMVPINQGETNAQYVKRVSKDLLVSLALEGQKALLREAIPGQVVDPGVTVS